MAWWPPEQWAEMLSGAGCFMCGDAHLNTNPFSDLIVESPVSFTRLSKNQTHAGYCVVILKRHAPELHDLETEELNQFWIDVSRAGQVISELFRPVKIDSLVMGHLCPHVHCHVYPQYAHDDPRALINIQEGDVRLPEEAQRDRVRLMAELLSA
jgi:diadenosine tetraphosphate (Ap4A) HIT family hydrolase